MTLCLQKKNVEVRYYMRLLICFQWQFTCK